MSDKKTKRISDPKVRVNSDEMRQGTSTYPSSTETVKKMGSEETVELGVLNSVVFDTFECDGVEIENSKYDLASKKFLQLSYCKYEHEHTILGGKRAVMTCPNCLLAIESSVRYVETRLTHAVAVSLIPLCLCFLPYCTRYFRNTEHYCPVCRVYLGIRFTAGEEVLKCCSKKSVED